MDYVSYFTLHWNEIMQMQKLVDGKQKKIKPKIFRWKGMFYLDLHIYIHAYINLQVQWILNIYSIMVMGPEIEFMEITIPLPNVRLR